MRLSNKWLSLLAFFVFLPSTLGILAACGGPPSPTPIACTPPASVNTAHISNSVVVTPTATPVLVVPGGYWIRPHWCEVVKDVVMFMAEAFPTNKSDPPIDHVNFTWNIQGDWAIACTANKVDPGTKDQYSCSASLKQAGAIRGKIRISVDEYDVKWTEGSKDHFNKAPNGERDIVYDPLAV